MITASTLVMFLNSIMIAMVSPTLATLASLPVVAYYLLYTMLFSQELHVWHLVAGMCSFVLFVFAVVTAVFCTPNTGPVMSPTPGNVCICDDNDEWVNDTDYTPLIEASDARTEIA